MGIPKQFVGIESLVTITSLAVHVDVSREVGSPWEGNPCVSTIEMVPCGEIVGSLQTVVCACVCGVVVGRDIEPFVSETERYLWREVVGMGDVAIGYSCAVDVDIRHLVTITATERPAEVPAVEGVEGNVECSTAIGAPIAVDVFWTCDAAACFLVIGYHVANGVACMLEAAIDAVAPMPLVDGDVHAESVGNELL